MKFNTPNLDRFVRAVHRRVIMLRALEGGGVGVLVASTAAAVIVAGAIYLGRDGFAFAIGAMAMGALFGVISGIVRRPTRLDAAIEADEQLRLADLLSTALVARALNDPDAWQRTVLGLAEARCEVLSPSVVVLNRFGARTWGGVGLAVAFVLTLGILSMSPMRSPARDVVADGERDAGQAIDDRENETIVGADPTSHAPDAAGRETSGGDDSSRPGNEVPMSNQSDQRGNSIASVGAIAHGDGSGRDDSTAKAAQLEHHAADASANAGGLESAGGGGIATGGGSGGDRGGEVSHAKGDTDRPAPWKSPSWQQDRKSALEALKAREMPDQYRDTIREYFDPQSKQ